MFENQKKINMEIKDIFYINIHPKDRLDIEFTACWGEIMPQEALTSFTVSDAYRHFDGQAKLEVSKQVMHRISNPKEQYYSAWFIL